MELIDSINQFYYQMAISELRAMNRLSSHPHITYNSLLYLDIISYQKNCTVSFLADAMQVSKSAVTIKVNELIKHGFVCKTQSHEDKRIKYLTLSEPFKECYTNYDRRLQDVQKQLKKQFSDADIHLFCEILAVVAHGGIKT